MSFLSIPFVLLICVVFVLLVIVKAALYRKIILLAACCCFYAYWDWRCFLLLSIFTVFNFFITRRLAVSSGPKIRRVWLISGIVINLIFLGFFKYFNFFIDSLNYLLASFSWRLQTLKIILPLGISFYTFESLSYLIDIDRETTEPAKSWLDYAIFMAFFPRVVSGPIVRAAQFFPQLELGFPLNFNHIFDGAQLILRGLLKKVVVADNLAIMTSPIFASPGVFSSPTIWIGVLAYSIQIFFDFSGYTDMAIGIAKIIGFSLPQNFDLPYTSQSIGEFWRRWHMTLSSWFRDYVFYPLEITRARRSWPASYLYLNIIIVFLLTGLWHGAGWNFLLWGGLYGVYLAIERLFTKGKVSPGRWNSPVTWVKALGTFFLVSITWVFFRSPSLQTTILILQKLVFLKHVGLHWMYIPALWTIPVVLIGGFIARWRNYHFPTLVLRKSYTMAVILVQIMLIYYFAAMNASPFIYFQF
jgi:alginate O-acetyltransferase complex protein AlgI